MPWSGQICHPDHPVSLWHPPGKANRIEVFKTFWQYHIKDKDVLEKSLKVRR